MNKALNKPAIKMSEFEPQDIHVLEPEFHVYIPEVYDMHVAALRFIDVASVQAVPHEQVLIVL